MPQKWFWHRWPKIYTLGNLTNTWYLNIFLQVNADHWDFWLKFSYSLNHLRFFLFPVYVHCYNTYMWVIDKSWIPTGLDHSLLQSIPNQTIKGRIPEYLCLTTSSNAYNWILLNSAMLIGWFCFGKEWVVIRNWEYRGMAWILDRGLDQQVLLCSRRWSVHANSSFCDTLWQGRATAYFTAISICQD